MRIYLVQHGKAMSKDEHPDRPLNEEGKADVERMAQFLGRTNLSLQNIFHSDKLRAEQTAEILGVTLNPDEKLESRDGLHAKDDVVACRDKLLASVTGDTMLVGHQPFMGKLASLLLTGMPDSELVNFQKGCAVCLQQSEEGGYQIEWMVTPAIV